MSRVVVIGAGVGGLAAAARLAAAGHEVTVCEQTPAGRFRFDTGPSLLTLPQVFRDLFLETGDPIESVLELRPVEPIVRYRFTDGTRLDSTANATALRARLDAAFGPGAGSDWQRLT